MSNTYWPPSQGATNIGVDMTACLKLLKCGLALRGPTKSCPFVREIMQRFCLSSEVVDKSAIVASQAAKSMYLCDASGRWPRSDSCYFIRVAFNALSADDMS